MIPILWLSLNPDTPPRGYWDMGMLEGVFSREMWDPAKGYHYQHYESFDDWKAGDHEGAVIIFPARAQVDYIDELNTKLKAMKWVVLMLTGDEEASFPVEKVQHPNIRIWVMSPREGRHDNYGKLGTGFPPQAREWLPKYKAEAQERPLDYFFAGQITHPRRQELLKAHQTMVEFEHVNHLKSEFIETAGFTQGLPHDKYYQGLASAKVAPAPSGPETPDSFRLFEALEAGCIPIADTYAPKGGFSEKYWEWFFGEPIPFRTITDYDQLQGQTIAAVERYDSIESVWVFSWWQQYKRRLVYDIITDIQAVSGYEPLPEDSRNLITVIIPTSVIPAHPDTAIIEETIASVRAQLPTSEIIISFDGIRHEQRDRFPDYLEYMKRVLWLCNNQWKNVVPVIFDKHLHQAGMAREVLKLVKTPTILYVEHDAPVTPDRQIEWSALVYQVIHGNANVIRLHHEELILPDHKHLMLDEKPQHMGGMNICPMMRTMQWSQRPHLADTAFYKWMIDNHFNPESRTMIEDVMHGVVHSHIEREGEAGWKLWRLWIYCPNSDKLGIKRSYHTDGRGADPKYDMIIKPVNKGDKHAR